MLEALQRALFSATNPELATFFWSMFPITELRASIPIAVAAYGLPVWSAYLYAVLGTTAIAIVLLLLLDPVVRLLRHLPLFDRSIHWLFDRTRKRFVEQQHKYGVFVALVLFVAIPLPGTGAWTGALAAYLVNVPFWRAFSAIFFGLVLSGLIVVALTHSTLIIF